MYTVGYRVSFKKHKEDSAFPKLAHLDRRPRRSSTKKKRLVDSSPLIKLKNESTGEPISGAICAFKIPEFVK